MAGGACVPPPSKPRSNLLPPLVIEVCRRKEEGAARWRLPSSLFNHHSCFVAALRVRACAPACKRERARGKAGDASPSYHTHSLAPRALARRPAVVACRWPKRNQKRFSFLEHMGSSSLRCARRRAMRGTRARCPLGFG